MPARGLPGDPLGLAGPGKVATASRYGCDAVSPMSTPARVIASRKKKT